MIPYLEMTKLLKVDVPVGHSGDWVVKRFKVDEKGADRHNLWKHISTSNN